MRRHPQAGWHHSAVEMTIAKISISRTNVIQEHNKCKENVISKTPFVHYQISHSHDPKSIIESEHRKDSRRLSQQYFTTSLYSDSENKSLRPCFNFLSWNCFPPCASYIIKSPFFLALNKMLSMKQLCHLEHRVGL